MTILILNQLISASIFYDSVMDMYGRKYYVDQMVRAEIEKQEFLKKEIDRCQSQH